MKPQTNIKEISSFLFPSGLGYDLHFVFAFRVQSSKEFLRCPNTSWEGWGKKKREEDEFPSWKGGGGCIHEVRRLGKKKYLMDYREVVDWFYDQVLDSIEISPFFFLVEDQKFEKNPFKKKFHFSSMRVLRIFLIFYPDSGKENGTWRANGYYYRVFVVGPRKIGENMSVALFSFFFLIGIIQIARHASRVGGWDCPDGGGKW